MTALLILIYVAFISLGIPDSLLGSVWPAMHVELGVSVSLAGILSAIICTCTATSSFLSARLIARFGTGRITAVSVLLTASALLAMSYCHSFVLMFLLCIPLGLGAGAIDSGLNNFVALHYRVRHMNWLHCFWGIGATSGPAIIAAFMAHTGQWRSGYFWIAIAQCLLALVMFASLPLWRRAKSIDDTTGTETKIVPLKLREALRLPLALPVLAALFFYCGAESVINLWGATFLTAARGIAKETAASWVSLFFMGITAGRLLAGFGAQKLRSEQLIRLGCLLSLMGMSLLLLPWTAQLPSGFFLIGLGFGPVYPCTLHKTPKVFGRAASQSVMGLQMACAAMGAVLMPPLMGTLAQWLGMQLIPILAALLTLLMLACAAYVDRQVAARRE